MIESMEFMDSNMVPHIVINIYIYICTSIYYNYLSVAFPAENMISSVQIYQDLGPSYSGSLVRLQGNLLKGPVPAEQFLGTYRGDRFVEHFL